jgi:tape measure domain-containing protein
MPIIAEELITKFAGDTKELDKAFRYVEKETGLHLTKVENLYRNAQGRLVAESNAVASKAGGFLPGLANISEVIQGIPQVGRMIGGLVSPLTSAVEEGVKFNAFLETSRLGFETMLGSGEKAQDFLNQLQGFANKTPFQFEDLVGASQKMMAFGFSAQQVIPILTGVGDALSKSGKMSEDNLDGVLRQLSQMRSSGRVTAEDMNAITNNGVPAWTLLAQAIGKTVAETRKLAEAGRLNGVEAANAIVAMAEQTSAGQMERMGKTLLGRMSNLEDIRKQAEGLATQGLTKDISDTLGAALEKGDVVTTMANRINALISPVSGLLKTAAVGVLGGGITSGLVEGIETGKALVSGTIQTLAVDTLIGGMKKWLGIESPSKEFHYIGEQSALGYIQGFTDTMQAGQGGMLNSIGGFESSILQRRRSGAYQGQSERDYYESILSGPQGGLVQAFFEAIRRAEGGRPNLIVGGKQTFDPSGDHPNIVGIRTSAGPSTAAGSYQITGSNWYGTRGRVGLKTRLGATNFDEHNQLLAAMALLNDRGGLDALLSGGAGAALPFAARDWTSTPGSTIGGGGQRKLSQWMGFFNQALAGQSTGAMSAADSVTANASGLGSVLGAWKAWDRSNPLPVQVLSIEQDLGPGTMFEPMTRQSKTINDTVPVNIDIQGQAEELQQSFGQMMDASGLILKPLQAIDTTFDSINEKAATLGAGDWAKKVIVQSEALTRRMTIQWSDIANGFEQIMGSAFDNVFQDGFGKSAANMALQFAQLLQQLAMKALAANIGSLIFGQGGTEQGSTKGGWLGKLIGWLVPAALGAVGGGLVPAGGGGGGTGGGGFHGGGVGPPGHAQGGTVAPFETYKVNEYGGEFLYMGKNAGAVFNQKQMAGMGKGSVINVTNHFHVTTPSGQIPRQTQTQIARQAAASIEHVQRRDG